MKMPPIRRLWSMYKRDILQKELRLVRRNEVTILPQSAFYLGAYTRRTRQEHAAEHRTLGAAVLTIAAQRARQCIKTRLDYSTCRECSQDLTPSGP